jgi:hypothetical protein
MRIARPLTVAVLVSGVLLTGCTDSSDPDGNSSPDAPATPTTGPWPLTGLPGYPDDADEPVVVVKVDDTPAGRPQVGIGAADLVVQELVEGGLTRLAAMYHSDHPDTVEPVRSVRASDVGIVLPTGGTVVASGGEAGTVRTVEGAGVPTITEDAGDDGFSRNGSRVIPFNLAVDVAGVVAALPASRPPGPYLPFGELPDDAAGVPASGLDLRWPSARSSFGWDPDTQLWTRTDLADPSDFAFTTVIAMTLPVRFDGQTDSSGSLIPTLVTEGSGAATIATGGEVFEVRWSKPAPEAAWTFTYEPVAEAGEEGAPEAQPFLIPPGRVWLALLPAEGGSVAVEAPEPSASP